MSDSYYTTRTVKDATVRTIINYAAGAEVREYEVADADELADLLMEMRVPNHGEWVIDVDVTYADGGEQ